MTSASAPDWLEPALRTIESWIGFQVRTSRLPGCTLAVARGGRLVAEASFGVADLGTGTVLTPADRFRVASHSKTFTAAGIMLLREAGLLHLDDPVGLHVADLSPAVGAITIAQLLSHTGGLLRDGTDASHWLDRRPFFDESALRAELGEQLVVDANSRFKYSNLGFGLLGLVVRSLTGESFQAWITANVITPAGLSFTSADSPSDDVPLASGHGSALHFGEAFVIPGRNATRALAAATGFTSTAGDLARFFGSLDPAAEVSLLNAASRREMVRRQWRVPHSTGEVHYGLGTVSGTTAGHDHFGHSGGFQGFISRTASVPDWGLTLSITTNAIDGLANAWVEGAIGILHLFATYGAPAATLADWTGRWWTIWGPVDLVPMGDRVRVALPALLSPLADASEIAVTGPDIGHIALANGFASHGEAVRLLRGPDGAIERLRLGGSDLLPETALRAEISHRYGAPR